MNAKGTKISHLAPGAKLNAGKYTVKRLIGAGGFGCTYEVTSGDSRYCIKEFFMSQNCQRMPDGYIQIVSDDVELVVHSKKKFMEEARVLLLMSHPSIVHVVDIFEENGTAYFAMDYIDGQSMDKYVQTNGPLSEEAAIGYMTQVANALDHVHKNNRLHLDIKPENIMIDSWGRAILIDFGASKFFDGEGTKSSSVFQTPGYAPIEQVNGMIDHFGRYTDIYALGATLYYMLSGVVPVSAPLRNDGERLEPLPRHISQPTVMAINKAMSIRRNDRQQSIEEFLYMLPQSQSFVPDVVVDINEEPQSDDDNFVTIDPSGVEIIPETLPHQLTFPGENGHDPRLRQRPRPPKHSWTVGEWILVIFAIALGAAFVFLLLMAMTN